MARPETLEDITPGTVTIATFHLDAISLDPVLLKGYTDMLAAAAKSEDCTVENRYNTVTFTRSKNVAELADQLRAEQSSWDYNRRQYLKWADGVAFEYPYTFALAKKFAEEEDLPTFPWDAEGRCDDHTVEGMEWARRNAETYQANALADLLADRDAAEIAEASA